MANKFWVLGTGNATDTAHWSDSDGGVGGAVAPGSADTANFTANSGGGICTIGAGLTWGGLNTTGGTVDLNSGVETLTVQGSVVIGSTNAWNLASALTGTGAQTFTSGAGIGSITINTTGTYTLQDAFPRGFITLTKGTFTANNQNINCDAFTSSGANVRTLNMGTGTWTIFGVSGTLWDTSGTNITVNASTSTLKLTGNGDKTATFGTSQTFNNFWNQFSTNHTLTITATTAVTFADFKSESTGAAAHAIIFPAGVTFNVSTFTVSGASGTALCTITSSSAGSAFTLSDTSGTNHRFFLSLKDSTATGGASWIASNSTNVSGNTGWVFQQPIGMFLVF